MLQSDTLQVAKDDTTGYPLRPQIGASPKMS